MSSPRLVQGFVLPSFFRYVENGSLAQTLKTFGKLDESLVASYVTKVLEGLDYLHRSQVSLPCPCRAVFPTDTAFSSRLFIAILKQLIS